MNEKTFKPKYNFDDLVYYVYTPGGTGAVVVADYVYKISVDFKKANLYYHFHSIEAGIKEDHIFETFEQACDFVNEFMNKQSEEV